MQCVNCFAQMNQPQILRNSVSTVLKNFQQPEKQAGFTLNLRQFTFIES